MLDELHYTEYDRAEVSKLAAVGSELYEVGRDVFYDTDNYDDKRWDRISQTTGNALAASVSWDIDARQAN